VAEPSSTQRPVVSLKKNSGIVEGAFAERVASGMRIVAVLPGLRFRRAPVASASSTFSAPKLSIVDPALVV
jgi:hypothetical protein